MQLPRFRFIKSPDSMNVENGQPGGVLATFETSLTCGKTCMVQKPYTGIDLNTFAVIIVPDAT